MKRICFLALAAVGLLLSACSDKDVVADNTLPEEGVTYENGYISVGINLPTVPQSITRATNDNGYPNGNFDLDDGDDNEYAVSSAYLLIFTPDGAESAAKFKTAFNLEPQWTKNTDPQVTTSTHENVVFKVGSKVAKNDLALVVLNPNSLITFTAKSGEGVIPGEQTVKIGETTLSDATTFATYQATLVSSDNLDATEMHTTDFYMTNSPLYAAKGSVKTPAPSTTTTGISPAYRTLVPIENVYETEQAAKDGTASEIFVERGMAKVTLKATPTDNTLQTQVTNTTEESGTYTTASSDITFSITGWTLDQTNSKSYLVRSTDGYSGFIDLVNGASKVYRFTGNTAIQDQNHPGNYKYRGYFAKDPNYDYTVTETGDNKYGLIYYSGNASNTFTAPTEGAFKPKYCFENTFDVAHQQRQNTTLAQIEVTVGDDNADLYTLDGVTSKIYKEAGLQTAIKNAVLEYCKANGLMSTENTLGTETSDQLFNDATLGDGGKEYNKKVTAITVKTDKTSYFIADINNKLPTNIDDISAQVGVITKYTGGKSYYAVRIKHFGDELTPWHVGTKTDDGKSSLDSSVTWIWDADGSEAKQPSAGDSYPDNYANDYLGRYGVLRNNWYDIQIGSIKTLGSPVPLDYKNDPTPDDELEGYINVKINILSWAKRTQTWNF